MKFPVLTRILLSVLAMVALPAVVAAQPYGPGGGAQGQQAELGRGYVFGYAPQARDLPGTVIQVINYVLILAGILALAFIIYGGFRYITSRGDENEVEKAKGMITNAVIGLVVIGVAAAVVNFVISAILFAAR